MPHLEGAHIPTILDPDTGGPLSIQIHSHKPLGTGEHLSDEEALISYSGGEQKPFQSQS